MVMPNATGNHGIHSTCIVVKFEANLPYSDVITKNGYAIGYKNHAFVFIIKIDGTMEARPTPIEKIGVWIPTDKSQKNASIGIEDKNIHPASLKTNKGDNIKS